jgi:hypothetical protein
MWRLTIYQKNKSSYHNDGNEVTFEIEDRVSCESESLGKLFDVIGAAVPVATSETRYEIVKVVD